MKTLLSFLFLLVSHCLFAQGPKVLGPLQRNGASDTYPTHLATLGKGGIHQVDDVAARDAIPADLRVENMVAIVKADGKWYKLAGGILNANWQEITFATPTPPLDDVLTAGNSSMQDMNIGKMFVNNGKLLVKEDGLFTIDADYAIAQFSSTSRGVTFPAMTTVERNAIGGGFPPGKSLFVYDVNLDKFCYYDGTSWRVIHPAVNLTTTGSGAPTLDAATNTINIPQTVSAYAHYYETGAAVEFTTQTVSITGTGVQSNITKSSGEISFSVAGDYEVKYSVNAVASSCVVSLLAQHWNGSSWSDITASKVAVFNSSLGNAANSFMVTVSAGHKIRFVATASANDPLCGLASGTTDYSFSTTIKKL